MDMSSIAHEDVNRVILHFDVDAMYVACERELNSELIAVPVGVSQYNPYGKLLETDASDVNRRWIVQHGVVKHSEDANGSLIAVSYEARVAGVKRNDRGFNALQKCPTLNIVQVPVKRKKANLSLYRHSSSRIFQHLIHSIQSNKLINGCLVQVEIASIDEIYLDVTAAANKIIKEQSCWQEIISLASRSTTVGGIEFMSNTTKNLNSLRKDDMRKGSHLQMIADRDEVDEGSLNWWKRSLLLWTDAEKALAVGAFLAQVGREAVLENFQEVYTLSAGIACNKVLAKLASGLKKPNHQTLIDRENNQALDKLFYPLPIDRIRGLGGKLGVQVSETLNISTLGQLSQISLVHLEATFSKDLAKTLYDIGRGVCHDEVKARTKPKSIECGKTFRGALAITDMESLKTWTEELCGELTERLSTDRHENCRIPKLLSVNLHFASVKGCISKSGTAPRTLDAIAPMCCELVQKVASSRKGTPIVGLAVNASSFVDIAKGSSSITAAFERSSFIPQFEKFHPDLNDDETTSHQNYYKDRNHSSTITPSSTKLSRNGNASIHHFFANQSTIFPKESNPIKGQDSCVPLNIAPNLEVISSSRVVQNSVAGKRASSVHIDELVSHNIDPGVWNELDDSTKSLLMVELGIKSKRSKKKKINSYFKPNTG